MSKKIIFPFVIVAVIINGSFLLFQNFEAYFITLLNNISNHPGKYSCVSFLALVSDIVLPVPSSIIMYMNGYVLGVAYGSLTSLLSLMASSLAGYYIGKIASISIGNKKDEHANRILARYGMSAILITRGIPVLSESICIVCGYNRMLLKKYLLLNLAGYAPLSLIYAFCGSLGYDHSTFLLSFSCSLIVSAAFWYIGRMISKKSENAANA